MEQPLLKPETVQGLKSGAVCATNLLLLRTLQHRDCSLLVCQALSIALLAGGAQ